MAIEIMDDARKKKIGLYSFLPLLASILAGAYHLIVFRQVIAERAMYNHLALTTDTYQHYTSLVIVYGIAALIDLLVLIYMLRHIIRLRAMNAPGKMVWAFLLAFLGPIFFPIFWYRYIRKEPRKLDVYPGV